MDLRAELRAAAEIGTTMIVGGAALTLRVTAAVASGLADWTERQAEEPPGVRVGTQVPDARALAAPTPSLAKGTQGGEGLDDMMTRLLEQASEQTTTGGRQVLFAKIIGQIVPDEARILSALSDGSCSPLVHVRRRSIGPEPGVAALENMSLVGRTANLALPHLTPNYVGHLLSLGLMETGPEDPSMKAEYEILLADMAVLGAIKRASRRALGARVERRTLRLSVLGRELWVAATGDAP